MNHSNTDGDDDYNNADTEADPTPFPPTTSCMAAMGIVMLLMLMCFIFTLVTLSIFILGLSVIVLVENWLSGDELEMEYMDEFNLKDGDLDDDEKAVNFLEAFFRAVKGKKVEGSIECFGSEEIAELGYRECSICMDDLEKGDKCLVFPGCGHIFHCKCIARWLKKKKLTCPVCRTSVAANANGARGFRRSSSWWVEL